MASISSSGLAAAAAIGRPQITATYGGITGSTRLIVVQGAWVPRFAYATNGVSLSIYTVDAASGQLSAAGGVPPGGVSGVGSGAVWCPYWITIDPAGKFAYTTGALADQIAAFTIDPASGGLTLISGYPLGYGQNYTGVDPSGSFVYASNGAGGCWGPTGSISGYAIDRTSGKLTPIPGSPFAAGCDDFSTMVFHPSGKFVYVNDDSGVSVFAIDAASGALTKVGSAGDGVAAIDPAGRIVIAGSESQGSAFSFAIDATTGALSEMSRSPLPLPGIAAISPPGEYAYVVAQDPNNLGTFEIFGYSIDSTTGALTPLPAGSFTAGAWPGGLVADPSGKFLYLLHNPPKPTPSTITTYAIDAGTGNLTALTSVQIPLGPLSSVTLAIALSP